MLSLEPDPPLQYLSVAITGIAQQSRKTTGASLNAKEEKGADEKETKGSGTKGSVLYFDVLHA